MVQQIRKLVQFLAGDPEGALSSSEDVDLSASDPNLSRMQRTQQLFVNNPNSDNSSNNNNARIRKLLPVIREYSTPLSQFGSLLVVRLSEKALSRGLNWASGRIGPAPKVRVA